MTTEDYEKKKTETSTVSYVVKFILVVIKIVMSIDWYRNLIGFINISWYINFKVNRKLIKEIRKEENIEFCLKGFKKSKKI